MPDNPVPIAGPADDTRVRFAGAVEPPDGFLNRLRDACGEVDTGFDACTAAGRDWWPLTMVWARQNETPARAMAVVRPTSTDEVAAVLRVANESRVPVTAAAGRSGVCGSAVPVFGGVVLDMTAMNGIVDVDPTSLLLDVRAGTFGDVLEESLRSDHGVTLGHWPQSIALSTVGGWLACRSAGQYSNRYGKIEDMVVGMEVVLADGRVITTGGRGPRAAAGPDLNQLFVGSEGTLGVITEARLRVHPRPTAVRGAAFGFQTFDAGLDACRRIVQRGAAPAVLRLYDVRESKRNGAEGTNLLLVLDEGEAAVLDNVVWIVEQECSEADRLDDALVERWLGHRNDVSGLAEAVNRDVGVDTCEISARWAALPGLYDAAIAAVKAVDGAWVCSAHQSHAYVDGACLYFTFAGQREGDPDGFYRDAWDAITRTTLEAGGALSHHHGVGLNRARFMREALGSSFDVLVTMKQALDPNGILNPGKLGLPSPFGPDVPW